MSYLDKVTCTKCHEYMAEREVKWSLEAYEVPVCSKHKKVTINSYKECKMHRGGRLEGNLCDVAQDHLRLTTNPNLWLAPCVEL